MTTASPSYNAEMQEQVGSALLAASETKEGPVWVPGVTEDGTPHVEQFHRHLFLYGTAGQGRTNVLKTFVCQIATQSDTEFVLFDGSSSNDLQELARLPQVLSYLSYQTSTPELDVFNFEHLAVSALELLRTVMVEHERRRDEGLGESPQLVAVFDNAEILLGSGVDGSAAHEQVAHEILAYLIAEGPSTGIHLVLALLHPTDFLSRFSRMAHEMSLPTHNTGFGDPMADINQSPSLRPGDLSISDNFGGYKHVKALYGTDQNWRDLIDPLTSFGK